MNPISPRPVARAVAPSAREVTVKAPAKLELDQLLPVRRASVIGARTPARAAILDEHFTSKNEVDWDWSRIRGEAGSSVGNGLELFTNGGATAKVYADAEIHTRQNYLYKNAEMVLSSPTIDKGSRGWGYWNHSFEPHKAEMAGFVAMKAGPDYPYNGLYIFTKHGDAGQSLFKLDDRYLNEPHKYSIEWRSDAVTYTIDNVEVLRVTGYVPNTPLGMYLWDDNAVWDFDNIKPILQDVTAKAPLKVQSLRIVD